MCGILGWYRWGTKTPSPALLPALLTENLIRGKDATGFAYQDTRDDQVYVLKAPLPANEFIAEAERTNPAIWNQVANSRIVIGHTRAKTQGDPAQNENNHPVAFKNWLAVHNGMISNDDDLFEKFNEPRFAAVDTAAIPLVLAAGSTSTESLTNLGLLGGMVTSAIWNLETPETLYLVRLGFNDVYLFMLPAEEMLIFSSVGHAMKHLPRFALGGLSFLHATRLPDNRILRLEPTMADSELLGLDQRPFRRFKARQVETPSARTPLHLVNTPSGRRGSLGPNGFRWLNSNVGRLRVLRTPDFTNCLPISFINYDLDIATNLLTQRGTQLIIHTPYGRWVGADSANSFFFRPHKSVKNFHILNKLPKWWDGDMAACPALDGKLMWEEITISEHRENSSTIEIPGRVCPWCGVIVREWVARRNQFTCEWCLITSIPTGAKPLYEAPPGLGETLGAD